MNSTQLIKLLHLADPTLPIGGFSHSAGLETYVQQGVVQNKQTAKAFISSQLQNNLAHNDGAMVSLAYDATVEDNFPGLMELDGLCNALKLPREMREASQKMGMRLLKIVQPLVANQIGDAYREAIVHKQSAGHYAIVFGIYSAALGIDKASALTGFLYNAVVGMVTNSVKLVPLGQLEGQQILFEMHPVIDTVAQQCMCPDQDKIGLCCSAFDIRCMQHERLYSRLYMS